MLFLRTDRNSHGANAIIAALAFITVANLDVMADTSYTGPPLSYAVYGPGGGCVDANIVLTGTTTSMDVVGETTSCQTDEFDTPDGIIEVYTKFELPSSCGSDFIEVTMYNCKDSACAECDADPETVGHMDVDNVRDAYNNVETCWQFYEDNESFGTFGNLTGLSAQRYNATNELSNLQEYNRIFFGNACGDDWFAANILGDTGSVADTSYTGPPLSYAVYGPGDGCDDANVVLTGTTTSFAVIGDTTFCETDELDKPDGTTITYTKSALPSCESDFLQWTMYNCKDSACADCDANPELVASMNVANIRDAYNNVETCWQIYNNGSSATLGNLTGVSSQRYDATNELSNTQEYNRIFLVTACGEAWFADNILADTGSVADTSSGTTTAVVQIAPALLAMAGTFLFA